MPNHREKDNKIRNQLIGFATFLLIMAIIMPWCLTDKSKQRAQTTPILQSNVVSQLSHEHNIDTNTLNAIGNGNSTNTPDIPYIPDDDAINALQPSDKSVDVPDETINDSAPTTVDGKAYIIQLVALKNRQKIDELVALLRLNNYDVVLVPKNPSPNQAVKLQVGPYAKKEQAEQVIIDLYNLTKLNGLIVTN